MPRLDLLGKEPWQPLNMRLCRQRVAELFHIPFIPWSVIHSVSIQNVMQLYTTPSVLFILQAWRWPSEVEACCQIQDTTLGVLTAIYFSSRVASSEKFWKSFSKWSRITWYKHCGVVFLSFTFEIFRVLISAEVQRSFMWQSKGLVEQVRVFGRDICYHAPTGSVTRPTSPPVGVVFPSRIKRPELDFHRSYGSIAEDSGAPPAIKC